MRVGGEAALRVGDADQPEQLDDAAARLGAGDVRVQLDRLHAPGSPTVVTGLRLVIGSWKIMPILAPRTARMSGTESERRSRPSKWMRAPGSMRPGLGISRMMASAVIDLPQPDSPTSASVSPAAIERLDPVDHAHAAALAGKRDAQALDRQQGRAHRPSLRVRGSMMSRMASAIMLTPAPA